MTVGETLTEARYRAGLSVDELSQRTRIRDTVIRSIEQDNYEACGGDLYVRGYVRAIAGAVGIDAQPLIREYDLEHTGRPSERANGSTGRHARGFPSVASPDTAPTSFDLPPVTAAPAGNGSWADPDATVFDLPAVSGDPAATSFDLPPFAPEPPAGASPAAAQPPESAETRLDLSAVADDLMAAGYDLTSTAPPATTRKKRRRFLVAAAVAVVLVAAAVLGVRLSSGGSAVHSADASPVLVPAKPAPATQSAAAAKARAAAKASAAVKASAAAKARAAAEASAAAKARQAAAAKAAALRAAAQRVSSLPIAAALAFGPDGFADGDNPGIARYAITRDAPLPWTTQWYDTPEFGLLKHGTGLLLDLGAKVTVTSVRFDLAQYQGGSLELRAGNGTAPQDLRVVATANNVGGVVDLTLRHPAAARYLVIWFTRLPPNGSGHYQESVSSVVISGRR